MTSAEQQALRSWAIAHLGLGNSATPDQIQAAVFSRARRDAFVPPPPTDFAFRFLSGAYEATESDFGWQQARAEVEAQLRKEVDDFAGRFFAMPPEDRQRKWKELWGRCSWVQSLRAHLELLKPALTLVPADVAGGEGPRAQLADMLCQLYVQRPPERARLRESLWGELAGEMDFWQSTAQDLREHCPRLVALDPVFFARLADPEQHAERARQARQQMAAARRRQPASSGGGSQWTYWPVFIGIMALSRLLGSCTSTNTIHNPPAWKQSSGNVDSDFLKDLAKGRWKVENGKLVPVNKGDQPPKLGPAAEWLLTGKKPKAKSDDASDDAPVANANPTPSGPKPDESQPPNRDKK
jgi:hypothetical protein